MNEVWSYLLFFDQLPLFVKSCLFSFLVWLVIILFAIKNQEQINWADARIMMIIFTFFGGIFIWGVVSSVLQLVQLFTTF